VNGFIQRATRFTLVALILGLTIMGLYVSSYLSLRVPAVRFEQTLTFNGKGDIFIRGWPEFDPKYRFGGEVSRALFQPLAWADWELREDYWTQRHFDQVKRNGGRVPSSAP